MPKFLRVAELAPEQLTSAVEGDGLVLSAPPFVFRIRGRGTALVPALRTAYAYHDALMATVFIHFDLAVRPAIGLRRWFKPLIELEFDGSRPFAPLPRQQAFPLLEWAMNWCVTTTAHQYLMCHSAVLAWQDQALLLPAPPGSGKSTLAAALMLSGWRLLSDELALLDPVSGKLAPFVRPLSLKNASIDIIAKRFPSAVFTPPVNDTIKGTVAHLRPSEASVLQGWQPARPRWLVFPRYEAGASWTLQPLSRPMAVVELAKNAFNLSVLGTTGFSALCALVRECECITLVYGDLDEALDGFSALSEESG